MAMQEVGFKNISHHKWWGNREMNSTGHNVTILKILKECGAPILEINGELKHDEENFFWFYETLLDSTVFRWERRKNTR
jgi:hypothetical protein